MPATTDMDVRAWARDIVHSVGIDGDARAHQPAQSSGLKA